MRSRMILFLAAILLSTGAFAQDHAWVRVDGVKMESPATAVDAATARFELGSEQVAMCAVSYGELYGMTATAHDGVDLLDGGLDGFADALGGAAFRLTGEVARRTRGIDLTDGLSVGLRQAAPAPPEAVVDTGDLDVSLRLLSGTGSCSSPGASGPGILDLAETECAGRCDCGSCVCAGDPDCCDAGCDACWAVIDEIGSC